MRVLVTDGGNRAALAVTRSLGARGHHVMVADRHVSALAQSSRFCRQRAVYPDPFTQENAFVDWLGATVRRQAIDVLLPVSDVTTLLVTKHADTCPSTCQIPFAPHSVIFRAADKAETIRSAIRLGVPVPRTTFLESREALLDVVSQLSYPVVVKPARSRVQSGAGWLSTSVRYAADAQALDADVSRRHALEFPLLLQERISGPGVGVFVCYDRGRLIASFSHRRLREKPPSGGVSVLSESIEMSPEALDYSQRLLDDIGWHGVAMVEFKRDERDGVLKLMEINGRFWGSLQLAIDAGVDFPAILVDLAVGRTPAAPPAYRVGVRSRWLIGDLDALLLTLRPGGDVPSPDAKRMQAIAQFLKFWQKDLYYENPRWSDLRPWLQESATWIRNLAS